jgi:hypothetical protein
VSTRPQFLVRYSGVNGLRTGAPQIVGRKTCKKSLRDHIQNPKALHRPSTELPGVSAMRTCCGMGVMPVAVSDKRRPTKAFACINNEIFRMKGHLVLTNNSHVVQSPGACRNKTEPMWLQARTSM